MLLLYLNPNAQVFAGILAVYLAGLGIGSALAGRVFARRFSAVSCGTFQLFVGVAVAGVPAVVREIRASALPKRRRKCSVSLPEGLQSNFVYQTGCSLLLTALLLFIPTLLMGAAFPFAARYFSSQSETLGQRIGSALTLNTFGAMLGPLICGFWLLPMLGTQIVLLLFCVAYIITGALAAAAFSETPRKWVAGGAVLSVGLIGACCAAPELIVSGAYESWGKMIHHEEDACGSVAIIDSKMPLENYRQLMVGVTPMISDDFRCRRYTRLIGHLPALLHPAPKKALVICMGSGMTLSALACHPEIEQIDCADISTSVVHCAREYFAHVNNKVLDDPRVHVIANDGRTHLLATRERYDIIALEPPPPNNADVANLYSKEFYELCKSRLNPGGIVAQWIPYHGAAPSNRCAA